jgi:hypothetical protein
LWDGCCQSDRSEHLVLSECSATGEELCWLGKLGLRGIAAREHFFILTSNDDGTTRLNHGERFSGTLVALAKGSSGNSRAAYEAFSGALKQRVEHLDGHS